MEKQYFDLALRQPSGKEDVIVFSCKEGDYHSFLVEVYDVLMKMKAYSKNNYSGCQGKYVLNLIGASQVLPGDSTISFKQDVDDKITWDAMYYSLSSAVISDIVKRIHHQEKGEISGPEKSRRDATISREADGQCADGIEGLGAAEEGSGSKS
jgi:hypothetical protein